ncbi:LysR family transcriptional regulator [Paenibacillus pini]|uniref:Transcriptional regulator n=1 Tax=Paenibacillus pini JCM 16418 TaxID=1236976 RepID=W7YFX8_9BACL|nr:LysR family transcriptional regulator [Paenibacillus pini]GAF06438.1 transcriptional regulator [Paenibacillus pini JCM 16418]
MNLLKLSVLVYIEKYKKVTDVAKELQMKQPTVTFHMKSLEEEMGISLFESKRGRILLTDAGKALYPYALKMTNMAVEAKKAVQDYTDLNKGILSIGADCMTGTYRLPDIISQFCSQYPGVQVHMTVKPTRQIQEMLYNHDVDFAFYSTQDSAANTITEELLWKDELMVIFGKGHTFSNLKALTPQLIAQHFFIQHSPGSFIKDFTRTYAIQNHIHLWERMVLDSPEAVKLMVQTGEYISFFAASGIERELSSGTLYSLPIPDRAGAQFKTVLAFPADQSFSPLKERFKQFVQDQIQQNITKKP